LFPSVDCFLLFDDGNLCIEYNVLISPVQICLVLFLDVTAGDKAASFHKLQTKSQLRDSGFMNSGSESLLKVIKVGCLDPVQLILIFIRQ